MRKQAFLTVAIVLIPASIWAQSMCTDANSPRECYEAGLKMMAEAMGKMEALKVEYDAKLSDLKKELTLPAGTVLAFTVQCPQGWSKLPSGDGNYVRISDGTPMESGGSGEITIRPESVPKLQLTTSVDVGSTNANLWGISGPRGQGKLYSFSDRDGGLSGVAVYPFTKLAVGSDTPAAVKIEPSYLSLAFCQKG